MASTTAQRGVLERRFDLHAQGTTVRREVVGGATTFLTMAFAVASGLGLNAVVAFSLVEATAPALVLVGFLLLSVARDLPWDDYAVAIPAFLTLVVMPFTYSITDGIGAGFVTYTVLNLVRRDAERGGRRVHPLMLGASVLFVLYFALEPLRSLLGM